MKTISKSEFDDIRKWMYRNARQLEIARWKCLFEDGSKEEVLNALTFYQNEDGGFGNTLEPDSWNPDSSPYTTLYALNVLDEIDAIDVQHPMIRGIIKYLESGVNSGEFGWYFSIPSNDNYAHAPWWTYDEAANQYESIGVTAGIVDFALRYLSPETALYQRALKLLDHLLEQLKSLDKFGDMGVSAYIKLLGVIKTIDFNGKYNIQEIIQLIRKLGNSLIERDPSRWAFYGHTPKELVASPDSEFYEENKEITQLELDYIIDTRKDKGVWEITWSWFDNNEKYAKEFAISENWWRAEKAIDKLVWLKKFGRIEK